MSPLLLESERKSISLSRNKFPSEGAGWDFRDSNPDPTSCADSDLTTRLCDQVCFDGKYPESRLILGGILLLVSFQIELETLNTATDEINKLEIELEVNYNNNWIYPAHLDSKSHFILSLSSQEANATFMILSNESTRRLKLLIKKLGSCIEKSRPYYDAQEKARISQIECQKAAVKFQRANGQYTIISCPSQMY